MPRKKPASSELVPAFAAQQDPDTMIAQHRAVFATIPWMLSPMQEMLSVPLKKLSAEQRAAVDALTQHPAMHIVVKNNSLLAGFGDTYRPTRDQSALSEITQFSHEVYFYPPSAYAPEWRALWQQVFVPAEERLERIMDVLETLPWRRSETSDPVYYLVQKELNERQQKVTDAAEGLFFSRKTFSLLHKGQYELKNDGRGLTDQRFYQRVHARKEAEYAQDAAIIAQLPWWLTPQGDLVVYQSDIAQALPDPARAGDLAKAIERRGIEPKDGFFTLGVPNTVGKLWDRPDGETDHGRLVCYEEASKGALARLEAQVDALAGLPWAFNKEQGRFEVRKDLLAARGDDVLKNIPEGTLLREGTVWFLPEIPFLMRPPHGTNNIIKTFLGSLAKAFENTPLHGAEALPWRNKHGDWYVSEEDMARTFPIHGLLNVPIPHKAGYDKDYYIPGGTTGGLKWVPYAAAISRVVARNQEGFLRTRAAEVAALPWCGGLYDKVTDFHAIRLFLGDLDEKQEELVADMADLNMVEVHYNKVITPTTDGLRTLLQPVFESARDAAIEVASGCAWVYSPKGLRVHLDADTITDVQRKALRDLDITIPRDESISLDEHFKKDNTARNRFLTRIGEKMCAGSVATVIPDAIRQLPWRYESRISGTQIRLSRHEITPAQKEMVEAAGFSLCIDDYDVRGADATYLVRAVVDRNAFAQLAPTAEAQLVSDLKAAESFPWERDTQGQWSVVDCDLSAEQQINLSRIPYDMFALSRVSPFSSARRYAIDLALPENSLVRALAARERVAPGPGQFAPKGP